MRRLACVIVFLSAGCTCAFGQISLPIIEKIKTIKLLESKREDVEKLLAAESFSYSSAESHYQSFWFEDSVVSIWYSKGTCVQREYEMNDWNVPEWYVVRVLVSPKDDFSAKDVSVDLSKFQRERTDWHRKGYYVYFDKTKGLAIETRHNAVQRIQFFPPKSDQSRLCQDTAVRMYYSSNRWMRLPDTKKTIIDYDQPPNVIDVQLEKLSGSPNQYSVTTIAKDPEGDVLTFQYKTSGGNIIGTGAKVIWDLSVVGPGKYTIAVGADDGCGICGRIVTKSVTIQ
jgi:hypothetical protein